MEDAVYAGVPVFDEFHRIAEPALYKPLPDGWTLGLADIVGSTSVIAGGGYKSVNMAGASVITAVANAVGTSEFPFVFGGDGACFAVPPDWAALSREALAATIVYVRDELGLSLRAAMVPISNIRAQRLDVRIARFAPSPNVTYAMFSGGGVAWAEKAMKSGAFAVEPAPAGARPDLSNLSCGFEKMPSIHGTILSLLVLPASHEMTDEFQGLLKALLALTANAEQAARPMRDGSLRVKWLPSGFDLEARARHKPRRPLFVDRLYVAARTLFYYAILRSGLSVGRFRPSTYLGEVIENSDFRKYADGLRMTLDCSQELADRIETLLAETARGGVALYGLHRQPDALMTCFTPTVFGHHFHFIDGAAGGYAMAAKGLGKIAPTTHYDGLRNPHLEQVAAELYSDEMPYHNFNHVLGTLAAGKILVDRCLREGVPINAEVVYYALLFHDAGYHENHIDKGYTSKEEYSAHLADQCLRAEAVSEDTIKRVVASILSTQRDAKFTSNEEKAVRAADLAGLASDYKTFRSNVEKLRQEGEMLSGRKMAWDEWKTSVKETISFYLSQGSSLFQPDALFYAKANQNLSRLLSEH